MSYRRALVRGRTASRDKPNVLVVGGGPVGLTMAYLLNQVYDIPTRIIEREAEPTTHPQAHFINLRTMEVLYSTMPRFHDRLMNQAAPSELWRDYIYTTGVGKSKEIAHIDQFGSSIPRGSFDKPINLREALSSLSPTHFLHFPQNRFETMLSTYVKESGIHVEREVELVDLISSDRNGRTQVSLNHKQTNTLEYADFDYVIGADGAHSCTRQLCNIEMVGTRNLQSIVNVHFTSKKLSKAAREHPGMLYFIFNTHVIGVLIAHDLNRGEWVLQIPFFPPQETLEQDFSESHCKEIVRRLLDEHQTDRMSDDDDVHILSIGQWQMGARVAAHYDHETRVFLVGDAAHQFPPAGGLGMNTGIQDAHNLAWKLAWSLQQQDLPFMNPHTLIRSYERERQHIAKINTQLSLRNVERTMKVPTALHVSHNHAKLLTSMVDGSPLRLLPMSIQREMIKSIMHVGKQPLALLDPSTQSALGQHMRQQVQEIVTSRHSLGMLFYHFDIGYSYKTEEWGTRARKLMQDSALQRSTEFVSEGTNGDVAYHERGHVGERFPHIWIRCGQTNKILSTVAVVDYIQNQTSRKVQFVLLVNPKLWTPDLLQQNDGVWKNVAIVFLSPSDVCLTDTSSPVSHMMVVDVQNATYTKWIRFTDHHAAALIRPDGYIGYLWDKSAEPVTSIGLHHALQQSILISST